MGEKDVFFGIFALFILFVFFAPLLFGPSKSSSRLEVHEEIEENPKKIYCSFGYCDECGEERVVKKVKIKDQKVTFFTRCRHEDCEDESLKIIVYNDDVYE